MFKTLLIIILLIANAGMVWLAFRNSTPLECTTVYIIHDKNVCVVNMHDKTDLKEVEERLRLDAYKYKDAEPTDAEDAMKADGLVK